MKKLPWHLISDWKAFEEICNYVIRSEFNSPAFSLYLYEGMNQEGIDITGHIPNENTVLTAQCKHTKKLTEKGIDKIIKKWETDSWFGLSDKFLILTRADLNNAEVQKFIKTQQTRLGEQQKTFDCWDENRLNQYLEDYPHLVEKYFSVEIAETHCFSSDKEPDCKKFPDPQKYIQRSLKTLPAPAKDDYAELYNYYDSKTINPNTLFDDVLSPIRILIVGDAQKGKTTLLQHIAATLTSGIIKYNVHWVVLKQYSKTDFKEILNSQCKAWKRKPAAETVIIADGLDELDTDDFISMVRSINSFAREIPSIHILISCRHTFFERYSVSSDIDSFSVYFLEEYSHKDLLHFLDNELGESRSDFLDYIHNHNLSALLSDPFAVTVLADSYAKGEELPATRSLVHDKFINNSWETTAKRLYKRRRIENKEIEYRQSLAKIAFFAQASGKRGLGETDAQQLIGDNLDLLTHCPLLSYNNRTWYFNNNGIQEHLAAKVLSKLDNGTIEKLVIAGTKLRCIRISWLQTLASLLSMSDLAPNKRAFLVKMIEEDEIILLTLTDRTKYSDSERRLIIDKIFNKLEKNNFRSGLYDIRDSSIALFAEDLDGVLDKILLLLEKPDKPNCVYTCWRVLTSLKLNTTDRDKLKQFILKKINEHVPPEFCPNILEILIDKGWHTKELVEALTQKKEFANIHPIRERIYEMLLSLNLVDDYYQFVLDGAKHLISHNRKIHHSGSEISFEKALIAATSYWNIQKLYNFLSQKWFREAYRHYSSLNRILEALAQNTINIAAQYPLIVFSFIRFVKSLDYSDQKRMTPFKNLLNYQLADNISFGQLVVRHFDINASLVSFTGGLFSSSLCFLNEDCFDLLCLRFEEGVLDIDKTRYIVSGLRAYNNTEKADRFYQLMYDASEGRLQRTEEKSGLDEYDNYIKKEHENDIRVLMHQHAFLDMLRIISNRIGKKNITRSELYPDLEEKLKQPVESGVVADYLRNLLDKNEGSVELDECIQSMSDPKTHEWYTIQIITYNYSGRDVDEYKPLQEKVRKYYHARINTVRFSECFEYKNNTWHVYPKISILKNIYKEFCFETPANQLMEMIWAIDDEYVTKYEKGKTDGNTPLSVKIAQNLPQNKIREFKKWMMAQFDSGIAYDAILPAFINVAFYLNLSDVKDYYFDCLNRLKPFDQLAIIGMYDELGGDTRKLLPFLDEWYSASHYGYFTLLDLLLDKYPNAVHAHMERIRNAGINSNDIAQIALRQAHLGEIAGLEILLNLLQEESKPPFEVHRLKLSIYNVPTEPALRLLRPVMFFLADRSNRDQDLFNNPNNFVMEILHGLASKSEDDLVLVTDFMKNSYEKLKAHHQFASDILWGIETILKKYRGNGEKHFAISELDKMLVGIPLC